MKDKLIAILRDMGRVAFNINEKADFLIEKGLVLLPCNVGDKVYQVADGTIYTSTINKIIYDAGHIAFDERAIGKSIFLTKEAAEQAMKAGADDENSKNNAP